MPEPTTLSSLRRAAGWSRDRAAVEARVSYALARLYEIDPALVHDPARRARLDAVYARVREIADARRAAA